MFVRVIRDSVAAGSGLRLTTIHVRVPRIIWPEIMTHRTFGRNARSSRAVPAKTMLAEIRNDPFVPWRWTRNQKGMQGERGHDAPVLLPFDSLAGSVSPEQAWLVARDNAVEMAQAFADAEYHKQVFNRLVEPFMWIDGLITSCQWNNFLWLRDHGDAEPHFIDMAGLVRDALAVSAPSRLADGEWHLPYVTPADHQHAQTVFPDNRELAEELLRKVSAARCARISYAPFDGNASYEAEVGRYDLLVKSERVHASPLEHQAKGDKKTLDGRWARPELHGNLPGFIQARKLVPNNFVEG